MAKVAKLKILKPLTIDWDVFGEHINQMDYNVWKLKNKTITLYHQLVMKELEWNKNNPDNKVNALMRHQWYGYKTLQSYIMHQVREEYENDGIYKDTLNGAIKDAIGIYKKNQKDVLRGNATIPNCKRQQPMFIPGRDIKVTSIDTILLPIFDKEGRKKHGLKTGQVEFKIRSNKNHANIVMQRILDGRYKICDSSIQRKGKDVYILLVFKDNQVKQVAIDKDKILGIDLGIAKAVTMQVDDTKKHEFIDGGEIESFRKRVNKQRRQKQNQLKYCSENRHGHGRNTLLKSLNNLESKIANFKDLTNHRYSKFIIDYAIENGCGTIQLEDLTGISSDDAFLNNWSYFDLQNKIKYKADEYGINVVMIRPSHTSQRCHECGYISKENRQSQDKFKCVNCGHTTHADLNAARNIAMKDIETIIKEQLKSQEKAQEKQGKFDI